MARVYEGFDVREYEDKLSRAIRRYGLPPTARQWWARDLNQRVWDFLGYMQPAAAQYWQAYLYNALLASDSVDATQDAWTITILDRRWHFGERLWNFAPGKIEYQTRRALKGLNYIVMIEFELFGNVHYLEELGDDKVARHRNQGRLIAPHIQGLIWGRPPSRRQRGQFAGGIFNAPGVTLKELTNFPGAVRYMIKPPYVGQTVHPRPKGGRVRYPWPIPLKLHHLMFSNLFHYSYPGLTFASGEGSPTLANAQRLWRDRVPSGIRPYAYPQRPFDQIRLVRRRVPGIVPAAMKPRAAPS
jgi:hypothetical protein